MEAKGILRRGAINLIHYQKDFYGEPLFIFLIKPDILVKRDLKGWLCDAKQDLKDYNAQVWKARWNGWKTPVRWSCALSKDKKCSHVLAAEMLLELKGFRIDTGSSFFQDLPPKEHELCSPLLDACVSPSIPKKSKKVKR